jgi:hypothetical protein
LTAITRKNAAERKQQYPSNPHSRIQERDLHEQTVCARLQAVRFLLENGLTRVEQLVQEEGLLTPNRQAQKLEVDDNREYFLQKLTNIRQSLRFMAEQLNLPANFPESKQVLQLELVSLTVLVEASRASHLVPGGGDFDQKVRSILDDSIENIALDLLNLRARVK